jgi:hypothetical protein
VRKQRFLKNEKNVYYKTILTVFVFYESYTEHEPEPPENHGNPYSKKHTVYPVNFQNIRNEQNQHKGSGEHFSIDFSYKTPRHVVYKNQLFRPLLVQS